MEFKPQKNIFLLQSIVPALAVLSLFGVAGAIALFYVHVLFSLLVLVLWVGLGWLVVYRAGVVYSKELYELRADRIVVHRGGLFSDAETDLQLGHVTHVKWIRPWLRHKFFGTGVIQIEAAGSAASEVTFRQVSDSDKIMAQVRYILHDFGFSMSTGTLLHREGPADLGIVVELIAGGIGGFFGLAFFFGPLIIGAAPAFPPVLLLAPLLVGLGVAGLVIHYLDLKRRVYSVYDGVVEYHEGFLTQNDAFIPVENLSNSETSRNLLDRLTDLYQVTVSCQGAGQEIKFRHLEQGAELDRIIEDLIDSQSQVSAPQAAEPPGEEASKQSASAAKALVRDTDSTGRFTMHEMRTLTPYLLCLAVLPLLIILFPLLFMVLASAIMAVVKMKNTTYYVGRNAVREEFDFFVSKTREFTTDKITGITFSENFIDRWFGTFTVQFWSIGAAEEITFRNIRREGDLSRTILRKAGINPRQAVHLFESDFSAGTMLIANLPAASLLLLGAIAGVMLAIMLHLVFAVLPVLAAAIAGVAYIYRRFYYRQSRVALYGDCLEFSRGLVFRRRTYALYPSVKDISTLKYPFVDNGNMRFNVAGEKVRKTKNGEVRIPYGFTMYYVPEILEKDDIFDSLLLGQATATEAAGPVMFSKKAAGNTVFVLVAVCTVLVPLLVLLPLILAIAVWRVKLVCYIIEPDRVLMRKGVLYRKQTSIIFDRIDHIQTGQGFLNKLFKNGNIIINTAGSSKPELVLSAIPNWQDFHRELRKHY